jgi:hypothetical protein
MILPPASAAQLLLVKLEVRGAPVEAVAKPTFAA